VWSCPQKKPICWMFSLHGGLSDRFHKRVTGLRVTFKRANEPFMRPSRRVARLAGRFASVTANRFVRNLGLIAASHEQTPGPVAVAVIRRPR
jgi:hypothetical protein